MSTIPYVIEQTSRGERSMIFFQGYCLTELYFWEKR